MNEECAIWSPGYADRYQSYQHTGRRMQDSSYELERERYEYEEAERRERAAEIHVQKQCEEKQRAVLEGELRNTLVVCFDLSQPLSERTQQARLAYVNSAVEALLNKSVSAWSTRLADAKITRAQLEHKLTELKSELRSRLHRQFWAMCVSREEREKIREHFRRAKDHSTLFKKLQADAQRHIDAVMTAGSVADLQATCSKLLEHASPKAGIKCKECKKGTLVERFRAFDSGRFWGCSRFPDCCYAWGVELGSTMAGEPVSQPKKAQSVAKALSIAASELESDSSALLSTREVHAESAPCTGAAVVGTTEEKKETVKHMAETKTAGSSIGGVATYLFEMTKDDTGDAIWRTSADRAVDILKEPTKIALRKFRTGYSATGAKFLLKAIDHPIGEGIFSWCAGVTLVGYGPLRGKVLGPRTARLSKELRVKGIKPITDAVSKAILDPVRKAIVSLIENLPEVALDE